MWVVLAARVDAVGAAAVAVGNRAEAVESQVVAVVAMERS